MKKVYWFFLPVSILALSGPIYAQNTTADVTSNTTVEAVNTTNTAADATVPAPEAVAPTASVGVSAETVMPQEPANPQVSAQAPAKEPATSVIKGSVEEVAADGRYLLIAGTKILTTKEMIDDAYVEVGDKVEASVEDTADGKKLVNLKYIFDDEEPSVDNTAAVVPSEPVKTEAQQ